MQACDILTHSLLAIETESKRSFLPPDSQTKHHPPSLEGESASTPKLPLPSPPLPRVGQAHIMLNKHGLRCRRRKTKNGGGVAALPPGPALPCSENLLEDLSQSLPNEAMLDCQAHRPDLEDVFCSTMVTGAFGQHCLQKRSRLKHNLARSN